MRRQRGFVLIAVLILVGCVVLVVTGIVFLVRGEVAGATNSIDATQLRAASWSSVQALASTLAAQRDRVLAGATPTVDRTFVLWESADELALARLLPVAPDGALLVGESSRVDLRTATTASLVATGFVAADVASAIIAERDAAGGMVHPESLLGAGGVVTLESLHGPLDEISLEVDEDEAIRAGDALERLLAGGSKPRGLADLLTIHADEPPLRADGTRRASVGGEWTDDRRAQVDVLLGSGSATLLEAVTREVDPASEVNLFAAWRARHPQPDEWGVFLDAITADDRPVLVGRLDVLRASGAALRSLPGVDEERAAHIEREREALNGEERRTTAWLVARGVLSADEFAAIVDRVTTRSLLWRARILTTIGPASALEDGEPGRFAVLDVVVDLSQPLPRVAWMRDVSSLETAARIVAELALAREDPSDRGQANESVDAAAADVAAASEGSDGGAEGAVASTAGDSATSQVPEYPRGSGRWRRSR